MGEAVKQKDARRERPNWGLALLMRPAKAAPRRAVRKFAAMPTPERLRYQLSRPSDPVVPYEPPCLLTVYIFSAGAPVKSREAGCILAPMYGWFTEGFDTLDLREAKALLDELAL
jgi:hypothetical protein